MGQSTGIFASLALIAVLGSFLLTFSGHWILAILAAVVALPLGIAGFVVAASPKVSGGILSILAILAGILAIGVALVSMIF